MEPETITESFLFRHRLIKTVLIGVIGIVLDDLYDKKIYGPAITRFSKKHFPQGEISV